MKKVTFFTLILLLSFGFLLKQGPAQDWGHVETLTGHKKSVFSVAFSPNGQILASASSDKTVRLWNPNTGQETASLIGHTKHVQSVAFSPNGQILASAGRDNTIRLWNPNTGQTIRTLKGHTNHVFSVAFSPNGQTLASASKDNTIRLWNPNTGQTIRELKGHTDHVFGVAFSPNEQILASASRDNTVRLWNLNTGQIIRELNRHTDHVFSVAFSPNGRILASASRDNTVRLWNPNTGRNIGTLDDHTNHVYGVAFSPNGQILASGSYDDTVRLWNPNTRRNIAILEGHRNNVQSIAFSPDGITIASGSWDNTVRLWRPAGAEPVSVREEPAKPVSNDPPPSDRGINMPDPNLRRLILKAVNPFLLRNDVSLGNLERVGDVDIDAPITRAKIERLTELDSLSLHKVSSILRGQPPEILRALGGLQFIVRDLTGLESAVNLKTLSLRHNNVRDISPLANLRNLETLDLTGNQIRNVSPLAQLTNLKTLNLRDNPIADATPLIRLRNGGTKIIGVSFDDSVDLPPPPPDGVDGAKENDDLTDPNTNNPPSVELVDNINIPDPVLRRKIAEYLDKGSNDPISSNDMLDLSRFDPHVPPVFISISPPDITQDPIEFTQDPIDNEFVLQDPIDVEEEFFISISPPIESNSIEDSILSLDDRGPKEIIRDITGLEFATNLVRLWLYNQDRRAAGRISDIGIQITDISPLRNLTNLKELYLDNTQITDISPLRNLTNLTSLNLGNTQITQISDISPLKNLTNLTSLNLRNNQITDISPLKNLTNLTSLDLRNTQISDISPLKNLTNLKKLYLDDNTPISDISFLRNLTNLEELYLANTQISDISFLRNLTNLTSLDLRNNRISDISPLKNLTNLKKLYLDDNNRITDVSPLRNLTNLETLRLTHNQITDISPLRNLTNLETLRLTHNRITDVSPLKNLTNLEELYLNNNQIFDLPQFENLVNLKKLVLWNNYIYAGRLSERTRVWLLSFEKLGYHRHLLEPDCNMIIPQDLEPLKRVRIEDQLGKKRISTASGDIAVSTVKGVIEAGQGRAWTPAHTVYNDSSYLVLTVQVLGTDGKHRDNLMYEKGGKEYNSANARINPPPAVKDMVEEMAYDWTRTANIELRFVDDSERDADVRIAFYDAEKLETLKGSAGMAKLGNYKSSRFEPTMWIPLDIDANYFPGTDEAKSLRGNLLHEFGHTLGFKHEHQGSNFFEIFEWNFDFDKEKGKNHEQFRRSYDGYEEIRTHIPGRAKVSNGSLYDSYLAVTTADEVSEFDPSSVMTYKIPAALLKVKDSAPSEKKKLAKALVDEIDETGKLREEENSPTGIVGYQKELSKGDREFIKQIYGERTPKAKVTGDIKIRGQDFSSKSLDFRGIYGSVSKFHAAVEPSGFWWTAGVFTQHKIRVEVYISAEKIVQGEYIQMGATALLYHGGPFGDPKDVDDLDDVACQSFKVFFDGTSEDVVLELENVIEFFDIRRVEHCPELGFESYNKLQKFGDKIPIGRSSWAEVTLNFQVEEIPAENRIIFGTETPRSPSARDNVVNLESDINGDGQVDAADLMLVAEYIGQPAPEMPPVDVNKDGTVTIADLVQVAQHLHLSPIRAAPALTVAASGLTYERVEVWIDTARAENDGSLVFRQGIENLEALLLLLVPEETALLANYPNPFNPETWIPYHLANPARVTLTIYAIDGKVVRRLDLGHQAAGYYHSKSRAAYWDGRNAVGERVASGIYFYTLTTDDFAATKKMLILK